MINNLQNARIRNGLAKLGLAMIEDDIKEHTTIRSIRKLATSYRKGRERPNYFELTQNQYNGTWE